MRGTYEAPNFDLLLRACQTTSKALFPNFMFLDTPFNKNEKWKADDPKRYIYELATMGCRTRVFENVAGEKIIFGTRKPFIHHTEHAASRHRSTHQGGKSD